MIGPVSLDPPVLLAPMAGITDLPFRRIVARFGAGLVCSEMVASQDVVQARPLARAKAELDIGGQGSAVQLAGRDPWWMAEAARLVESQGARIIDINMGCPAKRVTAAGGNGACGSALMREPDLALRLIEAVAGAVAVPVTLKIRLGWDDACRNAPQIARLARDAGVQMVTVHGRTRAQFYDGHADWAAIGGVVAAVDVPVIANGDIVTGPDAAAAMAASGARGVMVGRGAQGRPWALAQIAARLAGTAGPAVPAGAALADLACGHHDDMLAFYGADLGLRVARKHLGWYMDAAGSDAPARRAVMTATTAAAAQGALRRALEEACGARDHRAAA